MFSRLLYFALLTIPMLVVTGCQQRSAGELQGRWVGRPDSAAVRAARDAEKYEDDPDAAPDAKTGRVEQVTDWEKYDVEIMLDFASSGKLEMSLDGGRPRAGTWQIVATSPTGCTIEVQTEAEGAADGEDNLVRRRFEVLLDERNGTCVGFQLKEAGADPQVGALYFQRPAG